MTNKFYYKDGTTSSIYDNSKVLHRTDGPAAEYGSGTKAWYIDGKQHRIDGPAIEWYNGDRHWFVDHKRHRLDGPAAMYSNGARCWYVDDQVYCEKKFNKLMKAIRQLPLALRLIDPREWVRKL